MKSMADLNLEGKLIQIYPGDSVQKFGEILNITKEGIIVKVTKVDQGGWSTSDGWEVGSIQFLNWTRLKFKICNSELMQAA